VTRSPGLFSTGSTASKRSDEDGDVTIRNFPKIGIYRNTHFAFSDLNNVQIANLLSGFPHEKGFDNRSSIAPTAHRSIGLDRH